MLKIKKHARLLTLAIAIAMIVATMLAIPASAHQHEEGEVYFIYTVNGERVVSSTMINSKCGCSNPNYENYRDKRSDDHKTYLYTDHICKLVQVCTNCHWVTFFDGICVGGCASYCYYPAAPDWVYNV